MTKPPTKEQLLEDIGARLDTQWNAWCLFMGDKAVGRSRADIVRQLYEIGNEAREAAQLKKQVDAVGEFYNQERERVAELRAEIARLRGEKHDLLTIERELQAEIALLQEVKQQNVEVHEENERLRAEVARLQK
jgi:hypothetical protein